MSRFLQGMVLVVAVGFLVSASIHGQDPTSPQLHTVLTLDKLDCASCAKRIGAKINEVSGVAKIQYDVEKKLMWVHPQAGKQPSPRALWEAAEKANGSPTKLQGPYGVFTVKPQS